MVFCIEGKYVIHYVINSFLSGLVFCRVEGKLEI
jgi:hypothetical protein